MPPALLMGGKRYRSVEVSSTTQCSDLFFGYDTSDGEFQMDRALHFPATLLFADETPEAENGCTTTSGDDGQWKRLAIKLSRGIYFSIFVVSFLYRRVRSI